MGNKQTLELPPKVWLDEETIQKAFEEIDQFQIEMNPMEYHERWSIKNCKRIIIVGPQRSGTTFTSKAFAWTMGWEVVDEDAFDVINVDKFTDIIRNRDRIVVQAPAMTPHIHSLATEDDMVIFMHRKWSDIIKSVYRKNGRLSDWILQETMFDVERYHYCKLDPKAGDVFDNVVDKNSYYLNAFYSMWKNYQKDIIPNCVELEYESMSEHDLWIDKSKRGQFHEKQTTL